MTKTIKEQSFEEGKKYGWGLILLHPDELKKFLTFLFEKNGHIRILEIGCYKGMLVGWLHQNFPKSKYSWDYYGVDIIEPPDRRKDYPHYIMNAQALEFPANSFDAVIMLEVLEHIPDYVLGLREVHRVLKHGGGVFIQSVVCNDPNALADKTHFHVLHPETLKRLMEFLGFGDCHVKEGGNFAIWCFKE